MATIWNGLIHLIGAMLAFFYAIVPNYGVAILALTLIVTAALSPLTLSQLRTTQAMQALRPQIKALQEKWKDDKQRLNQELVALYKTEGVHPAGGCLPALIQLPIWIALYRVLRNSATAVPAGSALHAALLAGRTGFLGVDLLVAPAAAASEGIVAVLPYLVLVVAVVVSGYAAQTLASTRSESTAGGGAVVLLRFLPAILGAVSWRMPAGLILYWVASQTARAGQQLWLGRAAPAAGSASTP